MFKKKIIWWSTSYMIFLCEQGKLDNYDKKANIWYMFPLSIQWKGQS